MKKIIIIYALSATMFCVVGCNDFLDRSSYDQVSSGTAFSTKALAESVVTGAYSNLLYDYINSGREIINWDAFSSVMDPTDAHIYLNYSYLTGTIQPNDASFTTYWKRLYEGVSRSNDVINNIGSVPDMSNELKSQRIAEGKFLRAYHYYRLNTLWRGVPLYFENLANEQYTYPRSTEEQVWDAIVADLSDCIDCDELPDKYASNSSDYGRVTKGAAYALRGKVYMWQKKWAEAEADFKKIGTLGYSLYQGNYANLFTMANEKCNEMILSVQMENIAKSGNTFSYTYGNKNTTGYGNSSFFMNTNFVDSYEWSDGTPFDWESVIVGYNSMQPKERSVFFLRNSISAEEKTKMENYGADMSQYLGVSNEARIISAYTNRDPRLAATVITPYSSYSGGASGSAEDYTPRWPYRSSVAPNYDLQTNSNVYMLYSIRKFVTVGREHVNIQYNPMDVPIIRYADVLLGLAEAINEQGRYLDAIEYINLVRERAGVAKLNQVGNPHVAVADANNLRVRIRKERRWELACEEQLYYDELRWGTWEKDKFASGNGLLEVWGEPVYKYDWGGKAYTKWPIPSSEKEKNKNLIQNEGWQ